MAAYAATVTSLMTRAVKVDAVTGYAMYAGTVNVTNYNQTLAEITAITGKFKNVIAVSGGVSDSGFVLRWNNTSGAFEAFFADYDAVADGALIEAATDTDVGEVTFIAMGLV